MFAPRRGALLAATLILLVIPPAGPSIAGDGGGDAGDRDTPTALPAADVAPVPTDARREFRGSDGLSYTPAPQVVQGRHGDMYLGVEFDYYCALQGKQFDKGLRRLGRLAHLIARSGRRVVYTAAPNKSMVVTDHLRTRTLPQGRCDVRGMRHQARVMDHFDDPLFLPLRRLLAKDQRQVYLKTDHHWTSVGGSVFTQQVAERLGPRLASYQRYVAGELTMLGVLNAMLEIWVPETAEAAFPDNGVRVRTAPGSTHWDSMPNVVFDHSWNSRAARRTWRGHTLFMGDSFGMHALQDLRPMFRHGRFMWIGHVDQDDMVEAITKARTVVIEVYQTGVAPSEIGQRSFRQKVRQALLGTSK